MSTHTQPFGQLIKLLQRLDRETYKHYGDLAGRSFSRQDYLIYFAHIQGSPGAFPASICHLEIGKKNLRLPQKCFLNYHRKMATIDFILRALSAAIHLHTRPNRGSNGSGSFQALKFPPQILHRNGAWFTESDVRFALQISLPGSADNRIIAHEAIAMLTMELPAILAALKTSIAHPRHLKQHCDIVEDFFFLQNRLEQLGLTAFIGDGAVLPRQSGRSSLPLNKAPVAIKAPASLAVNVTLPHLGELRGLGIRKGVTVLIGSGFHGKSTLLNALANGVYPHIAGDGRERVVTHEKAVFISAEEGRCINGIDISAFMPELPGRTDPQQLHTTNASGSTSQAAAIVEAILSGAKLLLMDEDTCATNFLIRDRIMRILMPEDQSNSLHNRIQEIYTRSGTSSLIAVGGCSEYLSVADQVIAMRNYQPVSMTARIRHMTLPEVPAPSTAFVVADNRKILTQYFDPAYRAQRLGKTIAVRIKPLRLQEKILEFGSERLDLRQLTALVDAHQVLAIGYALLLAQKQYADTRATPAALAEKICQRIEREGLDLLCPSENKALFFAAPRSLELTGAINRLRNLVYETDEN